MTKVKTKSTAATTSSQKRSYEDTLNNLAHYLEKKPGKRK